MEKKILNLQLIKIMSDLDELIQRAAVQRIVEINSANTDLDQSMEALEKYHNIQDLIKEYIKTIPQHQIKDVKEFLDARRQTYTEIMQMADSQEQKEKLEMAGVQGVSSYNHDRFCAAKSMGQIASAMDYASIPARHQLEKFCENE